MRVVMVTEENLDEKISLHREILKRLKEWDGSADDADEIEDMIDDCIGKQGGPWLRDFMEALELIPHGAWFHYSHLGFWYCPTNVSDLLPVSNAVDYRRSYMRGGERPVMYHAMLLDSEGGTARERAPAAVVEAVFKSQLAQLLKVAAVRDQRLYHVDTGEGPMMATPEGKLEDVPVDKKLLLTGELVDRKDGDGGVELDNG